MTKRQNEERARVLASMSDGMLKAADDHEERALELRETAKRLRTIAEDLMGGKIPELSDL
jgi:hypothetical protein